MPPLHRDGVGAGICGPCQTHFHALLRLQTRHSQRPLVDLLDHGRHECRPYLGRRGLAGLCSRYCVGLTVSCHSLVVKVPDRMYPVPTMPRRLLRSAKKTPTCRQKKADCLFPVGTGTPSCVTTLLSSVPCTFRLGSGWHSVYPFSRRSTPTLLWYPKSYHN
jgi:hypothetical protein